MATVLNETAVRMRQTLAEAMPTADAREILGAGSLIRDIEGLAAKVASGTGWSGPAAPGTNAVIAPAGPFGGSDAITGYGIEDHPRKGQFLCEYRDGAPPFRTPRFVYDATAQIIARSGSSGMDFGRLLAAVAEHTGRGVHDPHGVRTVPDYL